MYEQVRSLIQSWESNKLTRSDIEKVAALLSDSRIELALQSDLEGYFIEKFRNDLTDCKEFIPIIKERILSNLQYRSSQIDILIAISPHDSEKHHVRVKGMVDRYSHRLPLHIIQFLFEIPAYKQDAKLREELHKYRDESLRQELNKYLSKKIREYERPLAARVLHMIDPSIAINLIPSNKDDFHYYPTVAAIHDAGVLKVDADPFAELARVSIHEVDDDAAGVNDEIIAAVLAEITSENLVDHVGDLIHKFHDPREKAKAIVLLEKRFQGRRDDLVAEWKGQLPR